MDIGSFEENLAYSSVYLIFPKDKMPLTLPHYVESNFFGEVAYRLDDHQISSQVVARDCVRLQQGSVDAISLRTIRFKEVSTTDTAPVEVFTKNCHSLHGVIWEEGGETVRKLTPPQEVLTDRYELYKELLKAFTIRRDPETGESVFYDRGVVDRLFRGETMGKEWVLPNRHDKVLIAVDMLRSTPKRGEDSLDMYRRYLLKNKRHADRVIERLPENWREYAEFLKEFYEVNK